MEIKYNKSGIIKHKSQSIERKKQQTGEETLELMVHRYLKNIFLPFIALIGFNKRLSSNQLDLMSEYTSNINALLLYEISSENFSEL